MVVQAKSPKLSQICPGHPGEARPSDRAVSYRLAWVSSGLHFMRVGMVGADEYALFIPLARAAERR
jgi:hypothetical protein